MMQRCKARGLIRSSGALLACCVMLALAGIVRADSSGVSGQAALPSANLTKTSGADEDPMDACLQKPVEPVRSSCAKDLVIGAERAVERAYQNALRVRRGREEEKRAHASELTLITSDLPLLVESQATWREEYEDECSDSEVGQEDRMACQYDLLEARLKDLQQMN